MRIIIVSAADAAFLPPLSEMLSSIEAGVKREGISVGILDLGLSRANIERLSRYGATIVSPGWDYSLNHFAIPANDGFKAMTARPHLPQHFPGYDLYVWLDADCWVQDWNSVLTLIGAGKNSQFAIIPEEHPGYAPHSEWKNARPDAWMLYYKNVRTCFGANAARDLLQRVTLNSGVFSATADAPHWSAWSRHLGAALKQLDHAFYYVEQLAIANAIFADNLAVELLPAKHNWACHRRLPLIAEDERRFIEPTPPYDDLGIIHLVGAVKHQKEFELRDLRGTIHVSTLRHSPLTA